METSRTREKERTAALGTGAGLTVGLLRGLTAEAHRSPSGEAYQELVQGPGFRLAVAVTPRDARSPQYSLVVLIDSPNRVGPRGRIPRGAFAATEAALAARGYVSTRLDNGWMAHQRFLARSRLAAEWRFLQRLLEGHGGRA